MVQETDYTAQAVLKDYLSKNFIDLFEMADLIFPGVQGHYDAKLALMCLLANVWDGDDRERIHVILKGKPGCGKSMLLEILESQWGALYITCDPKKSSLKGDGRKLDRGAQLLRRQNGGIVIFDDFEEMPDKDMLRDSMERGYYTDAKGGEYENVEAQCRYVAAANTLQGISIPVLSRFDLIIPFDLPTIDEAMEIVRGITRGVSDNGRYLRVISTYYELIWDHIPVYRETPAIEALYEEYFRHRGARPGRWIRGVVRIATALARLNLKDIGPWEISLALEMKEASDRILETSPTGKRRGHTS